VSMYYVGRGKDGQVQTNAKPHNAALKEFNFLAASGVGVDSEYSTSEAFSASSHHGADEDGEEGVIYLAFKYAASILSNAARICFTEARP
jgi:hypothetical protein